MHEVAHKILRFDRFVLDLTRGCLRSGDQDIDLRPKAFEVLHHLAENAGRLVPKQELYEAVWPNVLVTDDSLVQCIRELRQKLGDDQHCLIKTVSRRGYLLDVSILAGEVTSVPAPWLTRTAPVPSAEHVPKHEAEGIEREVLAGERKHVTVLCADLKGSLEQVAERDAEHALKVFDAVLELMTQAVHRYEGTVNLVTGDGIMALFGVPLAHEDHAIRACYAALQMQEAVKRYAQGLQDAPGVPILVRAGLSSGEAVIRSMAKGPHMDYRVMGQTTHLATRLGHIAAPGTLLVSAETLRLAEGRIEVEALEPANVDGLGGPVYQLVGAGAAQTRFQVLAARGLTGFVGRAVEMEQLERVQARVRRGHGQVVTIIGEPGVGKSRLLHQYLRSHHTSPWLALETASVSYGKTTSYLPVLELLKGYFKVGVSDDVRKMRDKVVGQLRDLDQNLAPDLPAFLDLLDVPVEDPSWQVLEAFERRRRTLDALKRLFLREAQQQPVILVLEDLQWIDGATQAFLETLIDGLASAQLLLILTYRPEYEHRWGGKSYYTQMRLDALSPDTTEEFLRNLLGDDVSLVGLKELLPQHGNPLFLEESIRALVETNVLEGQRGAYRLLHPLPRLPIAPTVQAILAARIDRLPVRAKRLLQAASVIGKDVPCAILEPIAELGNEELRCGLAGLQETEFLYEARLFPDLQYTFKHALTYEVAYGSLLAEQRRAFHRRIVEVIERLYPDRLTEHVERLAHHAVEGEQWEKAVHYFRRAGNKAQARSALRDARAWFEQALDNLQRLPESRSTLEQAFDIRLEVQLVLSYLGEPRRVLELLREAETLAERLNDERRRSRACARAMYIRTQLGELDDACASGARELAIAQALDDPNLRVMITNTLAMTHYFRCDHTRVVELASDNLAALTPDNAYENLAISSPQQVLDRVWLIMSLAELGRFSEAAAHEIEAIRLAELTRLAHTVGLAHRAAATLHLLKGDWAKARLLIAHWIEVARAGNVVLQFPTAIASSAWVLAQLGEASEALDTLGEGERLLEHQAASGVIVNCGSVYHSLGRACLLLGRLDEARRLAERAVESSASQLGFAAHALHLLGDVATHPDRFDAESGEDHYHKALALAEPRGMRPLIAHCNLGLDKLYRRTRKRRKAEEHLATAIAMYRDMDMRFWLEKAGQEIKV